MKDDFEEAEPAYAEQLMHSVLRDARAHAQPGHGELTSNFLAVQQRLRQAESPLSPSPAALPRRSESRDRLTGARFAGRARIVGWSALAAALGFWLGTRYERGLVSEPAVVPIAISIPATPAPPVSEVPIASVADQPPSTPASPGAPRGTAPARVSTPTSKAVTRAAPRPLGFRQVLELLRRAERARQGGTPELGLALLDEIDRGASRAVLREERLVTRALTLCDLGDERRARASARELGVAQGDSIYSSRLSRSCAAAATLDPADNP